VAQQILEEMVHRLFLDAMNIIQHKDEILLDRVQFIGEAATKVERNGKVGASTRALVALKAFGKMVLTAAIK
jgi:hypothetical protein